MKTELRFDRAQLRKPKRTPQGFIEVDGDIARPGIYEYRRADGTIERELKPPEVLAASLAAYDAISITNGHPRDAAGELMPVTADNVRAHEVGTVRGPARLENGRAVATLVIKDAKTIRDVEAGRRELSPGYEADVEESPGADKRWAYPGNPEGRWDTVQRRVGPNHLALVDYARGGASMRLRMDAAEQIPDEESPNGAVRAPRADAEIDRSGGRRESGRMADPDTPPADAADKLRLQTVRADEAERLAQQRADELTTARRDVDGLRAELATARERVTSLEAQIAAGASVVETAAVAEQRRRADEADRQLAELRRSQPEQVRRRASLITRVQAVKGPSFRGDSLTDRDLAIAGIKALRPKEDTSSNVSDEFLLKRFDSLVEDAAAHDASLARASLSAVTHRHDGNNNRAPQPLPWNDQWKAGAGQYATSRPKEG